AIGILWTSLRRFDRPYVDRPLFDDRRVFGSLAVGLVFGTIASVFALSIPRTDIVGVLVAVSASFLFEESFKLVWLNRRRYQGRFDTTFYGVPLGTGIAASGVVAAAWASRDVLYVPETFALLVLYSIGLGLINADTGALIGFGASRGEMWRYFLRAIAVRFAYGAFLFPFILPGIPDVYAALSVTTAAGFGLLIYYYVYRRILPGTLPGELRAHLPDQRRQFTRRVGSRPHPGRGDSDLKSTRAGRRLLFQVHALGPFASRADDDAVHSSREEHERGKAGAVVIHGDAQFFDAVVDSSELDTPQFGHLSHLPLHDLAEGVLRAVHVAFRDIAAEAVVP